MTDPQTTLTQAEKDAFGDDANKERGIGSRFAKAHPSVRAHLSAAQAHALAEDVIGIAKQLIAATERLAAANKEAVAATAAAKTAPPPVEQKTAA